MQRACLSRGAIHNNIKHCFSCLFSALSCLVPVDRSAAAMVFSVAGWFKYSRKEQLIINICKGCNLNIFLLLLIFCNLFHITSKSPPKVTTLIKFLNIYKTQGGIRKSSTLYFSLSASRQSLGLKLCQQMEHSCVHTSVLPSENWTCSCNYW